MFPGNGLKPSGPATSPSGKPPARRRGSSWLYSTLLVIEVPSARFSRMMPPIARLASRGPVIELATNRFVTLTPIAASSGRKSIAFVSWKKTSHFDPCFCHFAAVPVLYSRKCLEAPISTQHRRKRTDQNEISSGVSSGAM